MQFEDDEAVKAFIADKGEQRYLTKAQQAMRIAWLWPEPEKGGRGKKGKASGFSDGLGVSKGHAKNLINDARAVLAYSRELALAVRDGAYRPVDRINRSRLR